MKVVMNNAEMVPTPKKGTIIRFGDFGLTVIGIYVGVDNKWYYVYRPGISTSIIPLLELTKDEDEMFDYLKDISEFGHENPHN